MKRIAIAFLSLLFPLVTLSQDIAQKTIWEGKLGGIRLVLRVSSDPVSGKQVAVFDSPDQNGYNIPVNQLTITSDSLIARSAAIGGVFAGRFNADRTEITGLWMQGTIRAPMVMKLNPERIRPQTPKAPFPYRSEEVEYDNPDHSVHFGGTLTLPDGNKKVPAVILISGSGQQDRNETLFDHKSFFVLADHLTRNGIAVLRVDDRGVGKTTGEVMHATSADFAQDVLAGVAYLKSRKEIDTKQIGLIGHSEGGLIAPLVVKQSSDIAFMVSMAGIGVKGINLLKKQNADILKQAGVPAKYLDHFASYYSSLFDVVYKSALDKDIRTDLEEAFNNWTAQQSEEVLKNMALTGTDGKKQLDAFSKTANYKWYRFFAKYDPETTLPFIKIPVLAINGSKDIQVSAKENLAGFDRLLKQGGNKDYIIAELPELNHLFQTAGTGAISEYDTLTETISPVALEVITSWINRHVRK